MIANQSENSIRVFASPFELAEKFADELAMKIKGSAERGRTFTIALSGGSTPELLFSVLGDHFSKSVSWESVHFFWGDERCVPPDDPESNFGMTFRSLFNRISIPESNIHRIHGEDDPYNEVLRYPEVISEFTRERNGFPVFDLVILGLGEDGHTASIFPGDIQTIESQRVCEVAVHPVTMQRRITITARVINNADHVVFLVTGRNKAGVVNKIIKKEGGQLIFPASFISPVYGSLQWLLDVNAGELL